MAELFTNKYKMREFCQKNNFAFPEYRLCENVEQAVEFFRNLRKKMSLLSLWIRSQAEEFLHPD